MVKKEKTSFILFKELLRTIRQNIKQLISIIAISFLALCLFTGLTSNAYNLKERQDDLYSDTNLADVYVSTTGITDENITSISSLLKDNESLEKRIYTTCNIKGSNAYLIATEDTPTLSKPLIREGEEGFLLMQTFLTANNINIGDTVNVEFTNFIKASFNTSGFNLVLSNCLKENGNNFLVEDSLSLNIKVTGSMYHPEGVQNSSFSETVVATKTNILTDNVFSLISENYDLAKLKSYLSIYDSTTYSPTMSDEELFNKFQTFVDALYTQVLIDTERGDELVEEISSYFINSNATNFILAYKSSTLASYQALEQDVTQAMKLTFVFPFIFFLVSVLVIMTTLSQIILRNRQQIGIMKAIGVTRSRIYFHYISFGVVVCLIGGLLGFFLGPIIIPKVMNIKYVLLWDIPTKRVSYLYPLSILLLCLLILCSVLCTFFLSRSVIREKPVDTLRPVVAKPKKNIGNKNSFYSKHTPLELKMALRNIVKNKTKSIMVFLGMLGCTSLLVCGFGISDTLNYDVDLDYEVNQYIGIQVTPLDTTKSLLLDLEKLENVERAETVTKYPVSVSYTSSKETNITILEDTSSYFKIPYKVDGGITIDKVTSETIGASLNDTIKIFINGHLYERKITHIFSSSTIQGVFDTKENYTGEKFSVTTYNLTLKNNDLADETKTQIQNIDNVKSVMTHADIQKKANDLLQSIVIMTDVVKVFAILLCMVVIYNLTNLNIQERIRDIATLKVLGFHHYEINSTLTFELAIDSFLGSFVGLFVGYPLTILVMAINKTSLFNFIYHINFTSFLIAFVISFVTSIIISLLLNLKTKKINMTESLKSVE